MDLGLTCGYLNSLQLLFPGGMERNAVTGYGRLLNFFHSLGPKEKMKGKSQPFPEYKTYLVPVGLEALATAPNKDNPRRFWGFSSTRERR